MGMILEIPFKLKKIAISISQIRLPRDHLQRASDNLELGDRLRLRERCGEGLGTHHVGGLGHDGSELRAVDVHGSNRHNGRKRAHPQMRKHKIAVNFACHHQNASVGFSRAVQLCCALNEKRKKKKKKSGKHTKKNRLIVTF